MKNWKVILIAVAGVIAVILMCVFGVQSSQNKAISYEESVETAKSDIDTQLKRRVNVFSELADCVKQYDKHEYDTIKDTISQRGSNMTESEADNVTAQINAVAEAYPKLASQKNYETLMNEISTTENLIAQYKQAYNKSIEKYNRYIKNFPTRIFLGWTGYEKQEYKRYETDATDNEPVDLFGD